MKHNKGENLKEPARKRTCQLKIYVTESEEETVKDFADTLGMSLSSFGRATMLEQEIDEDPQELRRIRYELNKMGVNLNQLAKVANESGRLPQVKRLEKLREQIIKTLKKL